MNALDTPTRILVVLASIVVIVAGLKSASEALVPLMLSVFIAVIFSGPLVWLRDKRVPVAVAIVMLCLLVLGFVLLVLTVFGTSLDQLVRDVPQYGRQLNDEIAVVTSWLARFGIDVQVQQLTRYFDPARLMGAATSLLNALGTVLANGFLILLTVIFILLEVSGFGAKLEHALGEGRTHHFEVIANGIRHYMAIKTLTSLATGASVALGLMWLGVDYYLVWGVLAFLLNYVPNIGSFLAAVPAVSLALLQFGFPVALAAAALYAVVNVVIGNFIEPRVMGRGMGLSALVVFVSLIVWGWILGPVGMVLSVPLTMTLKIVLAYNPQTRWLAVLLGPEPTRRTPELPEPESAAAPGV